MVIGGFLDECRYLLHDRDTKHTQSFRQIIESDGVDPGRAMHSVMTAAAVPPHFLSGVAFATGMLAAQQENCDKTATAAGKPATPQAWVFRARRKLT